jgi:hypothetical protein
MREGVTCRQKITLYNLNAPKGLPVGRKVDFRTKHAPKGLPLALVIQVPEKYNVHHSQFQTSLKTQCILEGMLFFYGGFPDFQHN